MHVYETSYIIRVRACNRRAADRRVDEILAYNVRKLREGDEVIRTDLEDIGPEFLELKRA